MTNDQPNASTPFSSTPTEYEFSSDQNHVIGELAGAMRFVGTASVVFALVVWVVGLAILFLALDAGGGDSTATFSVSPTPGGATLSPSRAVTGPPSRAAPSRSRSRGRGSPSRTRPS